MRQQGKHEQDPSHSLDRAHHKLIFYGKKIILLCASKCSSSDRNVGFYHFSVLFSCMCDPLDEMIYMKKLSVCSKLTHLMALDLAQVLSSLYW